MIVDITHVVWHNATKILPTPNTGEELFVFNSSVGIAEYRCANGRDYWFSERESEEWKGVVLWAVIEFPQVAYGRVHRA